MKMHADEIDISVAQVAELVRDQLPRFGDLPVTRFDSGGTVNAIFRVGAALTARFPLRADEPHEVELWLRGEAQAASELADCSPVPVPRPVYIGSPGHGYPLNWSVQTWIPGAAATPDSNADCDLLAGDLAAFIAALRSCDTRGRKFSGGGRGGVIADHDDWMQECLRQSVGMLDVAPLLRLWTQFKLLPPAGRDVMSHTDLTPGNILVADDRLVGVLDGGGFGPADPALDLVGAWHLLGAGPRLVLRRELASGDLEWERGRAWAFQQAIGAAWYYQNSNPAMSLMGTTTLDRLVHES